MNMKTDIQVQQDALADLKWEPSVNAADIGVEVKDGIVTLAGSSKRNDTDILRAAENVMEWMTYSSKDKPEAALREVDAPTYRVWRLYTAACTLEFEAGGTAIY